MGKFQFSVVYLVSSLATVGGLIQGPDSVMKGGYFASMARSSFLGFFFFFFLVIIYKKLGGSS